MTQSIIDIDPREACLVRLLKAHPVYRLRLERIRASRQTGESLEVALVRLGILSADRIPLLTQMAKGYLQLMDSTEFFAPPSLEWQAEVSPVRGMVPGTGSRSAPVTEVTTSRSGSLRPGSLPESTERVAPSTPRSKSSFSERMLGRSKDIGGSRDRTPPPIPSSVRLGRPGSGIMQPVLIPGWRIGDCELICRLGAGASAEVWKARHTLLDADVAVKVLNPNGLQKADLPRFLEEARRLVHLNHPNIIRIYSCGDGANQMYIIAEYINGTSLGHLLQFHQRLPMRAAIEAVLHTALGLCHAWTRHVVHGDIKPDNIMVSVDGELKIADFGLSRVHHEGDEGTASQPISPGLGLSGSPAYMAPDFLERNGMATPLTDQYALGVTLYKLLTGELPYRGQDAVDTLRRHRMAPIPKVSAIVPEAAPLQPLLDRLMAKEPSHRFQEHQKMLQAIMDSLGEVSTPIGANIMWGEPRSRRLAELCRAAVSGR